MSTVYHPEINDQTENINVILEQYLQTYIVYLQNDWVDWLSSAEFVINNHIFEITHYSSFFINYKQHSHMELKSKKAWDTLMSSVLWMDRDNADRFAEKMNRINEDLQQQMCLTQAMYENFINHHQQLTSAYRVGDKVWLNIQNLALKKHSSKKLLAKYQNPYKVLEIISPHVYHLNLLNNLEIHDIFHINLLQLSANDSLSNQIPLIFFSMVNAQSAKKYEVEAIWDFKLLWSSTQLLVKWVGYTNPIWEPLKVLNTAVDVINDYYTQYSNKLSCASWEVHCDYIQSSKESIYNID